MKFKRYAALLLSAVLLLSVPAMAAKSSFSDVPEGATAIHTDILRLMGVVNGSGGNAFTPDNTLTRAQFCAMAVRVMDKENEVKGYANRVIFRDVTAAHWARGYVNLAASLTVGESGRLIAGVGDGRFLPDDAVTYAQAMTILLRMLGYGDADAGAIWPQGYLTLGAKLGMGEMSASDAMQPITRAKAAELFVNLLSAETKEGGAYYSTCGNAVDDVFLFSVGGRDGAVRTSDGVYYPKFDEFSATALENQFGALVLDEEGKLLAFVPDRTVTLREAVLSSDARETKLTTTDGRTYNVDGEIPVCNAVEGETEREAYSIAYKSLMEDDTVVLALRGGKPAAILVDERSTTWEPDEAIIVMGKASDAMFYPLTNGKKDYTVVKDGMTVSYSAIKPYDVVTYDENKNVLTVSDLRLPVVLDDIAPNFAAPDTVTAMGHEFTVLRGARKTLEDFKPGDVATLLLTAGGKVAGFAPADLDSTALGLASASGVEVPMPNGETLSLQGSIPAKNQGSFVLVRESKNGLQTSTLPSQGAVGDFSADDMTLGDYPVTPNVRIYETAGTVTKEVELRDLSGRVINEKHVLKWFTNTSGAVDLLVLESVTGDLYEYGSLKKKIESGAIVKNTLELTNADGTTDYFCTMNIDHGTLGGVVLGQAKSSGATIVNEIVQLKSVVGAKKSGFYTIGSDWYVTANGSTYAVAEQVEGYFRSADRWLKRDVQSILTQADGEITLHLDPFSGKVRIIEI